MMTKDHSSEDQIAFMTEITKEIARDHLDAYRRVLRCLIETEQGFLIHCMAGKDRTGFGVAMIQLMLGVSKELVMEDYLLTNQATELITRTRARMAEQFQEIDDATLEIIARVRCLSRSSAPRGRYCLWRDKGLPGGDWSHCVRARRADSAVC